MTMTQKMTLPSGKNPAIRVMAMPADTNAAGDMFGGWIMSQVDVAGSIAAMQCCGGRVVTVAVNSFQFHQPVFVGDLISCYADVTKTGTTSMTVFVEVFAERRGDYTQCIKVTEATLTYVAVDQHRKPRPVNPNTN